MNRVNVKQIIPAPQGAKAVYYKKDYTGKVEVDDEGVVYATEDVVCLALDYDGRIYPVISNTDAMTVLTERFEDEDEDEGVIYVYFGLATAGELANEEHDIWQKTLNSHLDEGDL